MVLAEDQLLLAEDQLQCLARSMAAMAPNQLALRHEDAIRQLEELAELLQGRHDALR